jgi:hypothetical protein
MSDDLELELQQQEQISQLERELAEARAQISDMEIRHAATMFHTQSVVDEANKLREQRDMLAEAQNLLKQCLSAMPVGYIPTHTEENLPI